MTQCYRLPSLFVLVICLSAGTALAQLQPGDIMFIAFLTDGDGPGSVSCGDGFAFVALADIPNGTQIFFTEDEYNSGFSTGEGDVDWTNTTGSTIGIGTVVLLITHSESNAVSCGGISASQGSLAFTTGGGSGNWNIGTGGDEIYAYLGSVRNPTTWLSALISDVDANNVPPAALSGFVVNVGAVDEDADLGIMTSGTRCTDKASCVAAITNVAANWTTEDESSGGDCCDANGVDYPGDIPPNFPGLDGSLPVEWTSFRFASSNADEATLHWTTASESDNAGFEIQHQRPTDPVFHFIGFVEGHGTTTETQSYTFRVSDLEPGLHRFRLKQIDFDGTFAFSSEVEVLTELPEAFHLSGAYPNPFNPATALELMVATDQHVRAEALTLTGQRIRTLFSGRVEANQVQSLRFDATGLPTGSYLVRVVGQTFSTHRMVTLIR